ncbi:MAG TPA: trypsin-like peptidase domain-containing protein, partial [Polyangiales bacterium]|nr:trypsin-like peptidase domain-containing protein [Polyangiales bacterium]
EAKRKIDNPLQGTPFDEWFGGGRRGGGQQYQIQRGTGAGVVLRADGYILTNKHVVENASRVEVVFHDGRKLVGKTLGIDDATDLAVVKVDAKQLPTARFADSSQVKPGQWVVAIGSPFGLDYSVTVGVVSATGRGGVGMNEIEDYLQTDASINPGNSGGPLVNLRGEVVGINTMIIGGGSGIGFAIPASIAQGVAEQLIDKGSVHRAYIGVAFQELTPELAAQFGVTGTGGALVTSLLAGGPADKAGIQPGDVIVTVDGKAISESRDLLRQILAKKIGSGVKLGVVRNKQVLALTLVTIERPHNERAQLDPNAAGPAPSTAHAGLRLQPLDAQLAQQLGYQGMQGALVVEVAPGSPAERAGLQQGDLILDADRKPVLGPADVDAALTDGSALLRVRRRDAATYMVLRTEP